MDEQPSDADEIDETAVQHITIRTADLATTRWLLMQMASAGVSSREATRRWRRAWRPARVADLAAMIPNDPPLSEPQAAELLPGEVVLWRGRPVPNWRVDLPDRLIAIAKSSPWIIGSLAAAVALSFFGNTNRTGGSVVLIVIAVITLFGQFMIHIWTPIKSRLRLRHAWYVLTTHRVIVGVNNGRSTRITSNFFDDATRVELAISRDGRGTITIGLGSALEMIPAAASVHTLLLRAVAGFREVGPLLVSPPATEAN